MLILIVAGGPDKGRIYEWADDQTVIVGRESKQLRLSDDKASRQHARFMCEGGKWYISDLKSRHGTFVNKQRIDGKTLLEDGDRVQVGITRFVIARAPGTQAERSALLGDQPTSADAWSNLPTYRRFIPSASTAAALTAAAVAISFSAWLYHNTTHENRKLLDEMIASQSDATRAQLAAVASQESATDTQLAMADRTGEILAQVRTLNTHSTPVLNEILASVQSQDGNSERLSEIHLALTELQETSEPALHAILARVESQSDQLLALTRVRDAVIQQQADTAELLPQLRVVAAAAKANEASLAALHKQIEQAQARPDLGAKMLDQLEAVAFELRARPTADQVVAEVRLALADEYKQTAELLGRIESRLDPTLQSQQLIAPLREALTQRADQTQWLIVQAFDRQDATAGKLADLQDMIRSQPGQTAKALRDVVDQMSIRSDLDAVLASVRQIEAGVNDPQASALLQELAAKLGSAPTSQQLADAVAQAVTEQLGGTRPLLEQIASSLDAAADQDAAQQELIDQVRLALLAQEEADVRLDEIYSLLASGSAGSNSEALQRVLREIRSKSIAGMDELRSTIRREIQAGMSHQRLAMAQDLDASAVSAPSPAIEPTPLEHTTMDPGAGYAWATPRHLDTASVTDNGELGGDGKELTQVEQAYRLAFKTGRLIMIGGGRKNLATGEITPGRVLDPAAAKAAGINDWRDWYLMDDFAERMRMQQQAMKYQDDRRGKANILDIPTDATAPTADPIFPTPSDNGR